MTLEIQSRENLKQTKIEYQKLTNKLQKKLLEYGLTQNQTKVYLFLEKNGSKTAIEISRSENIPRTETYQLLNALQDKGIVTALFRKPRRFNAISFEEGIQILIVSQSNHLNQLATQKDILIKLWNAVQDFRCNT